MKHISEISQSLCLKLALFPADKSTQKDRIMHLWANGLPAGDVERLFQKYDLGAA